MDVNSALYCRVYYDPNKSFRGAKLCMVKKRTEAKQVPVPNNYE